MDYRDKFILILAVILVISIGYFGYLLRFTYGGGQSYSNIGNQATDLNTIVVYGVGKASGKPDIAIVILGVSTEASNASRAVLDNARIVNNVTTALASIGISKEDIETVSYSLYPKYSSSGYILIGFVATHTLKIKVRDLNMTGKVIDYAVSAGANRIYSIRFTFTEDKLNNLKSIAREEAIKDARNKAEEFTKAAGIHIQGIASIKEIGYQPRYYSYPYYITLEMAARPATEILPPSEIEITVMVEVSFIIG